MPPSTRRPVALQRLVVAGCMVQRYREELQRELPEIDDFVGLDQLDGIVRAVQPASRSRTGGRLRSDLRVVASAPAEASVVPSAGARRATSTTTRHRAGWPPRRGRPT